MDNWPTLPQLARELGVADSTARRWASSFSDLLPTKGHGASRRFHPQSRDVLKRVQSLYAAGLVTEQIKELLHRDFPATIDVVDVVSEARAYERSELKGVEHALLAIVEHQKQMHHDMLKMQEQFTQEIATTREENAQLRNFIEIRLEERDQKLMETLRAVQETKNEENKRQRSWWPWRR